MLFAFVVLVPPKLALQQNFKSPQWLCQTEPERSLHTNARIRTRHFRLWRWGTVYPPPPKQDWAIACGEFDDLAEEVLCGLLKRTYWKLQCRKQFKSGFVLHCGTDALVQARFQLMYRNPKICRNCQSGPPACAASLQVQTSLVLDSRDVADPPGPPAKLGGIKADVVAGAEASAGTTGRTTFAPLNAAQGLAWSRPRYCHSAQRAGKQKTKPETGNSPQRQSTESGQSVR